MAVQDVSCERRCQKFHFSFTYPVQDSSWGCSRRWLPQISTIWHGSQIFTASLSPHLYDIWGYSSDPLSLQTDCLEVPNITIPHISFADAGNPSGLQSGQNVIQIAFTEQYSSKTFYQSSTIREAKRSLHNRWIRHKENWEGVFEFNGIPNGEQIALLWSRKNDSVLSYSHSHPQRRNCTIEAYESWDPTSRHKGNRESIHNSDIYQLFSKSRIHHAGHVYEDQELNRKGNIPSLGYVNTDSEVDTYVGNVFVEDANACIHWSCIPISLCLRTSYWYEICFRYIVFGCWIHQDWEWLFLDWHHSGTMERSCGILV